MYLHIALEQARILVQRADPINSQLVPKLSYIYQAQKSNFDGVLLIKMCVRGGVVECREILIHS